MKINSAYKRDVIDRVYDFLCLLKDTCTDQPKQFQLTESIKNFKIPKNIVGILIKHGCLIKSGPSKKTEYLWSGMTPSVQYANKLYDECREELNSYQQAKRNEKKTYALERGNTVRVGMKTFVRVVKPFVPTTQEKKELPSTPTELRIEATLNKLKSRLSPTNSALLSFSDWCDVNSINMNTEKALIQLHVVVKRDGRLIFNLPSYDIHTIRDIIRVVRNYKEDGSLPYPTMEETFSSTNTKQENTTAKAEFISEVKQNLPKQNCFLMLKTLKKDLEDGIKVTSITPYLKQFKLGKPLSYALSYLEVVKKQDAKYKWIYPRDIDYNLVNQLYIVSNAYNRKLKAAREEKQIDIRVIHPSPIKENSVKLPFIDVNDYLIDDPTVKHSLPLSEANVLLTEKTSENNPSTVEQKRTTAAKLVRLGMLEEANILLDQLLNN